MRSKTSAVVVMALAVLLVSNLALAATVQINEPTIRTNINVDAIRVSVPVTASSATSAVLKVSLLDPLDKVVAESEVEKKLVVGANSLEVTLPHKLSSTNDVLWYRIRYVLTSKAPDKPIAEGVVSVGATVREYFELRTVHQKTVAEGETYDVRVQAYNPVTNAGIAGVHITGTLSFGDDEEEAQNKPKIKPDSTVTNTSGHAILRFRVPNKIEGTEGEMKIKATNSQHDIEDSLDVELNKNGSILITTDKMLYQPGQSFHARALVLDVNRRAIPDAVIDFTLEDPDNETVYRAQATTNKFGIANTDWDLPESLRLGTYRLAAQVSDSDRYSEMRNLTAVRVSRYDLPEFTVTTKPDRTYYLAGQNAQVDVNATYLFGKPVTHGSVRLVEEEDRHWNYAEQKWEVKEHAEKKAELDTNGHASFTIDLKEKHNELTENDYRRFYDYDYAAYITDQTTGKTEQRRFKLRLSRDPIHVYVSQSTLIGNRASFYVTTSRPDGSPLSCSVDITEIVEQTRPEGDLKALIPLKTIKTNRYGAAKVENLRVSDDVPNYHTLTLRARDAEGGSTSYEENFWGSSNREEIAVTTDKALYKKGEPIVVSLLSDPMPGTIVVNALVKGSAVWSANVNLRRGKSLFIVPYQPTFTGEVVLTAYPLQHEGSQWELPFGVRTVLYPHNNELKVNINTERASYKPGEQVAARLHVTSADGTSDASALGVVVVDKAVEERARTDDEFGGPSSRFWDWGWWYGEGSVGGVSMQDIEKLDMTEPVPDGLDLVAEVLLANHGDWSDRPEIDQTPSYAGVAAGLYRQTIDARLNSARLAILDQSAPQWKFPTTEAEVNRLLQRVKIDTAALRDPWNSPFKFEFDLQDQFRIVRIISAGPDKAFRTSDDIPTPVQWNYFTPTGNAIEQAIKAAYARDGKFIRDFETLRAELLRDGIDLNQVRDPWGGAYSYKFDVQGIYAHVAVSSHGPQVPKPKWEGNINVWNSYIDFFGLVRNRIDEAIHAYQKSTGGIPHDEKQFDSALQSAGFTNFHGMSDPWGHAYRTTYLQNERYGDSVLIQATSTATAQKQKPVTQTLRWVVIYSDGADGKPDTSDDVTLARYSQIMAEQSAQDIQPKTISGPALGGSSGAIDGTVIDQTGAVIPGATVTATEENRGLEFLATTDDHGSFLLRLTPGVYRVNVSARGFRAWQYQHVTVHALSVTSLKVELMVGSTAEMVTVEASAVAVQSDSGEIVSAIPRKSSGKGAVKEEIFTPRLRDYFPETLYWAPSLITTNGGSAKLNFKLADNITTWKMSVLASTADGHVGTAEKEIQAFQPFFVALDPPKVLTVGDQIDLPVTVRNYLSSAQTVQIEMKPADWYKLLQPGKQNITVPTADSTNAMFPFLALAPVKAGKQQVLAANRTTGDAIEKPVTVHPDGQEESRTASALINDGEPITLELPEGIMPNSLQGQLKVYPNLLAHVGESIEASLERPYGCGEQTISSTYPSVLLLKYYETAKLPESDFSRRARKYLNLGYQRLLNYQAATGGFTYWGHGEPDLALTAYAIRFLNDASSLIKVDPEVIADAQRVLLSAQKSDGSWQPQYGDHQPTTAYVARMLALSSTSATDAQLKTRINEAIKKALTKLDDPKQPIVEPYTMSMYALTASDSGSKDAASAMLSKLAAHAHKEGNRTFWELQTNTPFYGWGRAGRVETTAAALQALMQIDPQANRDQITSGVLFLLKEKDRYGVWYSGQATVNVLQTLMVALASTPAASNTVTTAAVTVNGKPAGQLQISNSPSAGPVYLDLSKHLASGTNQIALDRQAVGPYASVQAVATYYLPWKQGADVRQATRLGESRALRLSVSFDKTEAKAGDTVKCSVRSERIGHFGYGMMLAEIGLPPGADVDRSSLQKAVEESGWSVSRYDVLPDRVILYLWPYAGGAKVDFTFRPRFGLKARTAPSLMYDYYNPDEQVTLSPVDFKVASK